ncbi:Stk1 family PASTA domain-containing Ser/Thr kinase [Anaerovoracaceae bacterium 42-11]
MSKLLAGRYELIEKIGEGGMAVVYKARCRLLNRYVAIKILRPEFTKDGPFLESFKRESQAAAGLQHPNIVSVYDVGKEGDINFIVMELIDGRPLSDIIREEAPMNYKRAIEITRQVASALGLAHRNNIIHRDVKPHNIMITRDGTAKLADFGIAKAVSNSTIMANETNRVIGSVHYFSPEQARGAYVDERSDIYSLGIVLYEMLTGQVPFDGENPVQVALMHINDEITPPSQLVSGIPPALEKLVMKATDKFQSNRYKNTDEMIEELGNIDFVTKMVGDSIFAASDIEEFQEKNRLKQRQNQELEDEIFEDMKPQKKKEKKQKPVKSVKADDDDRPARKSKKPLIIAAAVIGVIALTGAILFASGFFGGGLKAPDLEGKTTDEAEAILEEMGLEMEVDEQTISSEDIEEGKIAAQDPRKGEKVSKGDTITVILSNGKPNGQVPSVVGMNYNSERSQVEATLENAGYELGVVHEVESDAEVGEIISQDPGFGSDLKKGSKVDITISKGTDKVAVPPLTGITLDKAREALEKAGLHMGQPKYEESTVYAKNIVIGSSPGEGTKVEKGSTVIITVSKGEPVVTPPEPPENNGDEGDDPGDNGDDDGGEEE